MTEYTIEQIIFGLRKKYLENEKLLNELNKYVVSLKENVGLSFEILKKNEKVNNFDKKYITDLKISLDMEQLKIARIFSFFIKRKMMRTEINSLINGDSRGIVYDLNRALISIDNENDFYSAVDGILGNKFVSNTGLVLNIEKKMNFGLTNEKNISIMPNGIVVEGSQSTNDEKNVPTEYLCYLPKSDSLTYYSYTDSINNAVLHNLLKEQIDTSMFSTYYQDIIEAYKKSACILEYDSRSEKQEFDLVEDSQYISIVRKRV